MLKDMVFSCGVENTNGVLCQVVSDNMKKVSTLDNAESWMGIRVEERDKERETARGGKLLL